MNVAAWVVPAILMLITGLLGFGVKMVLSKLEDIKREMATMGNRIDRHVEDHARGMFAPFTQQRRTE